MSMDINTGEIFPRVVNTQARYTLPSGEINNQPSQTIPDSTMPLRTLIERYVRGIPVPTKTPIWDNDGNDLPDIRTLDFAERQELAQQYTEELKSIKQSDEQYKASLEALKASKIDSTTNQNPTNEQ